MKGVILAGGTGTRLRPLTEMINKHLLPVGDKPMICHAVEKLAEAGITEIVLVIGNQSAALFTGFLGGGAKWSVRLTYKIQEEAGGIAQALALAEDAVKPGEKLVVLLGDNLFGESLTGYVQEFARMDEGALVFLKPVEDPRRYGVPVLADGRILQIVEKPETPPSSFCVTGIYMYDGQVFDLIRSIKPSRRGELEITDVNNAYAAAGKLHFRMLDDWWIDAGTFPSWYEAIDRVRAAARKS